MWRPIEIKPGDQSWRAVPGYEGVYEVSEYGSVRSSRKCSGTNFHRILKPEIHIKGYARVNLNKNRKSKHVLVHRLVAQAFLNPELEKQVNHKDGNKLNNHYSNLEFVTAKENQNHAVELGLRRPFSGEFSYSAKLNLTKANLIRKNYLVVKSQRKLARIYNVSQALVNAVLRNKAWV